LPTAGGRQPKTWRLCLIFSTFAALVEDNRHGAQHHLWLRTAFLSGANRSKPDIRESIIGKGLISKDIDCRRESFLLRQPAIPACIVVLDKDNSPTRTRDGPRGPQGHFFMVDASKGLFP